MAKTNTFPTMLSKYYFKSCLARFIRGVTTSPRLRSEELNVHRDSPNNNPDTPFEFTEANMKRLTAIIQNYPEGMQRAAVVPCLDLVQRQMGWVPISAMHKVAELLTMPRMRVYEIATFYTMINRKFKGKYLVKVCVTTPCMIMGSDCILNEAEKATGACVGGISADGMFGLETVQCQGACVNAPLLVVDDDYYEDVTEADVHNIINTIRTGGIPPVGPQSCRFASEPISGQTTLLEPPPGPGHGLQPALGSPPSSSSSKSCPSSPSRKK